MMNLCCQDQKNRVTVARDTKRWHERCTECGRNHYGMDVDPIRIGLKIEGRDAAPVLLAVH